MLQVFPFTGALSYSATSYVQPFRGCWEDSLTADNYTAPWPVDGDLEYLFIELNVAPGAGKSWTFTVMVNGADSACTFTISDTDTTGVWSGNVAITAGDLIIMRIDPTNAPSGNVVSTTLVFDSTDPTETGYLNGGTVSSLNQNCGVFGSGQQSAGTPATTGPLVANVAPLDGSIVEIFGRIETGSSATTITCTLYKNGVAQDGTGGTPNATLVLVAPTAASVTASLAVTVPFVEGDILFVNFARTSGASRETHWACRVSGPPYQSITAIRYATTTTTGPRWGAFQTGEFSQSWTTSAGLVKPAYAKFAFKLSKMRVYLPTAPGAGKSYLFELVTDYPNTPIATGVEVTLSDTNTQAVDAVNEYDTLATDTLGLRCTPTGTPAASYVQVSFVQTAPSPPVVQTTVFTREQWWRGSERLLGRIKFFGVDTVGADEVVTWSGHVIRGDEDDATTAEYEGRVLSFGYYERALSGLYGDVPVDSVRVTLADVDNAIRGRLGVDAQSALLNTEVEVALITESDWRAGGIRWLTIFRGIVSGYTLTPDKTFAFEFKSYMAHRLQQPVPLRELTTTEFPGLPEPSRGKYAPLLYGGLARTLSTASPPAIQADSNGTHFYDQWGVWRAGWGETASAATPVTNVAVAAIAGGSLDPDRLDGRYAAVVSAVDGSDVETRVEPIAQWYNNVGRGSIVGAGLPYNATLLASGTQTIRVTWTTSGASKYRVYLAYYYYGIAWVQRIEVTHPTASVDFDIGPPWIVGYGDLERDDNISTGADRVILDSIGGSGSPQIIVTAIMAEGETAPSAPVVMKRGPNANAVSRFTWTAVPSALGYAVYKTTDGTGNTAYQRIETTNTYFEDDGNVAWANVEGLYNVTPKVPCIPVGTYTAADSTLWEGFLVCYGVAHSITGLSVDATNIAEADGNWVWPGHTNFTTLWGSTPYRQIGAMRYTLVYGRGADASAAATGEKTVTVDANGYETVGDGSGTAIENLPDQLGHFLDNFVLRPAPHTDVGGNWLGIPTWADVDATPRRDAATFAQTVLDMAATILTTTGAWYLAARDTIGDVMKRVLQSMDASFGWSLNGQAILTLLPPPPAGKAATDSVDHINDIIQSSFQVFDQTTEWANAIPYEYELDFATGKYGGDGSAEDATLQAKYKQRKVGPTMSLWAQPSGFAAANIAQRALYRQRKPPRSIFYSRAMPGVHTDLSVRYVLTHPDGPAAAGYDGGFAQIWRMLIDVDDHRVDVESWDLDWIETIVPNWLWEEVMAELDLGGWREGSPLLSSVASETVLPLEYRDRLIQWSILPEGVTVAAVVEVKVGDATLTVTPQIYNVTDAAAVTVEDVDGNADPFDPTSATSYGVQTRYLPRPADGLDKVYRLRGLVTDGDSVADPTRTCGIFGTLRVEL